METDVEIQYFRIKRGVRQGDPLSPPILFNRALERMLREYRNRNKPHDAFQEIASHFGVEKAEIEKKS